MTTPPLVLQMLQDLGLEVGDYHHGEEPFTVVTTSGGKNKLYQVKFEGWGSECAPGKGKKAAKREADALAKLWLEKEGWAPTGVVTTSDPETWYVTWGLRGPFSRRKVREAGVDLEEVLVVEA